MFCEGDWNRLAETAFDGPGETLGVGVGDVRVCELVECSSDCPQVRMTTAIPMIAMAMTSQRPSSAWSLLDGALEG